MSPNASVEQKLLSEAKVLAVIGLSTDFRKDSRIVAAHMQRKGYRIVPVHPKAEEILGETAYPSIPEIPDEVAEQVDLVNVFRPADEVPGIVEDTLEHLPNALGVWTQKGIEHEDAAQRARDAGLHVVQDRCIRTQQLYARFGGGEGPEEVPG